ncbi:uncharacterized protein LOC106884232 [Octopus bimaculoides]|uniref:Uncharacterized protein n=1 Tax=Octopus bimaculoides TaxID=37653 RepID=A0A0L8I468_OCTBM|nr:uncharacterized protein LOC106884232 [Octopus bimaculoides]|eukprot:XP_014790981.1 PREDICTED: uncharacterized protein LOC106884232 [Octopus bimaculoides]
MINYKLLIFLLTVTTWIQTATSSALKTLPLPQFQSLKKFYPGYKQYGGKFNKLHLFTLIGCNESCQNKVLHDTSALRLSYALNQVGGVHSLGKTLIRLSTKGEDSVSGTDNKQYIFHPIAYGPYLADKYGYPNVSKLHATDPIQTMKKFYGKQGILRIITYVKQNNMPNGHVALWDCTHFHQSKNWLVSHELFTLEFWESPDSSCKLTDNYQWQDYYKKADPSDIGRKSSKSLRHKTHNKHKGSQRYQHLLQLVKSKQRSKKKHHQTLGS